MASRRHGGMGPLEGGKNISFAGTHAGSTKLEYLEEQDTQRLNVNGERNGVVHRAIWLTRSELCRGVIGRPRLFITIEYSGEICTVWGRSREGPLRSLVVPFVGVVSSGKRCQPSGSPAVIAGSRTNRRNFSMRSTCVMIILRQQYLLQPNLSIASLFSRR